MEHLEEKEKYVIVGCKLAELEKDGEIDFTTDKTFEEITQLADKLWKEFERETDCEYFSEFVPYRLKEIQKRIDYKYYVEIYSRTEESDCPLAQSNWYDTEEECYEFLSNFDFVDYDLCFSLMGSKWANGTYTDIEVIKDLSREVRNRDIAIRSKDNEN